MATKHQTGPRLTITGTCSPCEHLRMLSRLPASHVPTPPRQYCAHPEIKGRTPREIGGKQKATPAWCPLFPAARLALARSVVAEAEPLALPLPGDAPVNPKPATWDDGERR